MLSVFLKLQSRVKMVQRLRLGVLFLIFHYFLYIAITLDHLIYFILCLNGFIITIDYNSIRSNAFVDVQSTNLFPTNKVSKFIFLLLQETLGLKSLIFITTLIAMIFYTSLSLIDVMNVVWNFILYNTIILSVFFLIKRFAILSVIAKAFLSLISMFFIMVTLFIYLGKSKMDIISEYINATKDIFMLNVVLTFFAVTLLFLVDYLNKIKPFTNRDVIRNFNKKYWY